MNTFEKTENVMVRPVVEQLRQLILIHHSAQKLENLWNGNGSSRRTSNKKKAT